MKPRLPYSQTLICPYMARSEDDREVGSRESDKGKTDPI